jgi:uncharacterized repeat protein (TIGR03803 family)
MRILVSATKAIVFVQFVLSVGIFAQTSSTVPQLVVLHSFTGTPDGATPAYGSLIRDVDENLYGTTSGGGTSGKGAVFQIDSAGTESVLYSFTGEADGSTPYAGVIHDSAGYLYGVTTYGGESNCGTVFKLDLTGNITVLYTFTGEADGCNPEGGLVHDSNGTLYGTTFWGGLDDVGVIFAVTAIGGQAVLHNFRGTPDGQWTDASLIQMAGNLYGTTEIGGKYDYGTVFRVDDTGMLTVLYNFEGEADGANPQSGLTSDSAGNLYGTTLTGGTTGDGVVFMLDTTGVETTLHSFAGPPTDGSLPHAGVIRDSSGNLYGTTYTGGSAGFGIVYTLNTMGTESVLYNFTGGADGGYPYAGVVRNAAGNLYGTTSTGGTAGAGVVFMLQP